MSTVILMDSTKNVGLDAMSAVIDRLSLHSGAPSTTGANELSGGGYARQTPAWTAASAGVKNLTSSVTWSVPASTVAYVGMWTNSGAVYRGHWPVPTPKVFTGAGTYILSAGSITLATD